MVDVKCNMDLCIWCSFVSGHGICKKDDIKINFIGECESYEYADEEDSAMNNNDASRRRSICNWLVCALKEAGEDVLYIDLKTDGECEGAIVMMPRGIFKINVTGDSDIQMMIDILTYIKGR